MEELTLARFGFGESTHGAKSVDALGAKGAYLCDMAAQGLPVPPGLVVPTKHCMSYLNGTNKSVALAGVVQELMKGMAEIEKKLGRPTLWSVRSGAAVSMPGMMETILNVGITPDTRNTLYEHYGKDLTEDCWDRFKAMFEETTGLPVQDDWDLEYQLLYAVGAVWGSWNGERAKEYRKLHGLPDDAGTGVVVQAMVFGNAPGRSCSGVVFTRDPSTGENALAGEFLPNAQGEDVVSGKFNPQPIEKLWRVWPGTKVNHELLALCEKLEAVYGDVQDVEFTVEDEKLWLLQTRSAKRSARAAFRIAAEYLDEDPATGLEVAGRITKKEWRDAHRAQVDPGYKAPPLVKGAPASGGVGTGTAVFTVETALNLHGQGKPFVLVRPDTSPDDIAAMAVAQAIVTEKGGMTCHAAVVARAMGVPCVVGVENAIDAMPAYGTYTVCGNTGRVWEGEAPVTRGDPGEAAEVAYRLAKARGLTLLSETPREGCMIPVRRVVRSFKGPDEAAQALSKIGAAYRNTTGRHPVYFVESAVLDETCEDEMHLAALVGYDAEGSVDAVLKGIKTPGLLVGRDVPYGNKKNLKPVRKVSHVATLKAADGPAVYVERGVATTVFGDVETVREVAGLWNKEVLVEPVTPEELFK